MENQAENESDAEKDQGGSESSVGVGCSDGESPVKAVADDTIDEEDLESSLEEKEEASSKEEEDTRTKYLRALADLENFKKRSVKERAELIKYSGENIVRDLLEVVDSLELALNHANDSDSSETIKGVQLILDRFLQILGQHSIRSVSVVGQEFDPNTHDAISSIPSADHKPGTVIEEFKKAYFYKDKLIRPGQAVVAAELAGADVDEGSAVASEDEKEEEKEG